MVTSKGIVDPVFWKGKKVFLTGHTGFKGSWLSLWLQNMGAILKGYSLEPNTTPNLFTGMQNVHGPLEWVSTSDMALATEVMLEIIKLNSNLKD